MLKLSQMFAMGAVMLLGAPLAQAVEKPQEWELVNPSGVIKQAQVEPAKRITSLDGKQWLCAGTARTTATSYSIALPSC